MQADPTTFEDDCSHRIAMAWVASCFKGGVHVISLYLIDTVGLNDANKKILENVTAAIKLLEGPWVIAGDWSVNLDVLPASGFLQMVDGALMPPPTLPATPTPTIILLLVSHWCMPWSAFNVWMA